MRTMKRVLLILSLILLMPIIVWADAAPDGAALFKSNCAICHGPDGKGQTATGKSLKVKDLGSKDVQKKSNADLQTTISDGKGSMPAYKGKLDQAGIDALIAFIRTLKK